MSVSFPLYIICKYNIHARISHVIGNTISGFKKYIVLSYNTYISLLLTNRYPEITQTLSQGKLYYQNFVSLHLKN